MIIYPCIKFESNTLIFSKDIKRKPFFKYFSTLIKGRNSKNNWWILLKIELDLYFIIICLCIKYESNTLIFSKVMARKPFFKVEKGTYIISPKIIDGFYSKLNLTYIYIPVYKTSVQYTIPFKRYRTETIFQS